MTYGIRSHPSYITDNTSVMENKTNANTNVTDRRPDIVFAYANVIGHMDDSE